MEFSVELLARRIAQQLPAKPSPNGSPDIAAGKTGPIDLSPLWAIRDDESFLREAYLLILDRPADVSGFTHYRELLRSGVSRRVVAHHLAASEEARQSGRRFTGLPQIPAIAEKHWRLGEGKIRSIWVNGLSRLHSLHRALLQAPLLERVDNKLNVVIGELERRLDLLSKKTDESLWTVSSKLDDYVSALNENLHREAKRLDLVSKETGETSAVSQKLAAHVERLSLSMDRGRADLQEAVASAAQALDRLDARLRETSAAVGELRTASAETAARLETVESRCYSVLDALGKKMLAAHAETAQRVDRGAQASEQWLERISRDQAESRSAGRDRDARLTAALETVSSRLYSPAVEAAGVIAVEVGGFIVGLPAAEWRLAAYHVFRGPLEPGLLRCFERLVRPGMTVVDVGANVGLFSLHAARGIAGSGRVVAFEPAPDTFRLLKDNIQVNGYLETGLVRMLRQAVSERPGTGRLAVYPNDCGLNTLFPSGEPAQSVDVELVSLDSALAGSRDVGVVKIDAEGAEPFIVRGMRRLIADNPEMRILLEFAPSLLSRAGVPPSDCLKELRSFGLNLALIDDVTGDLRPLDETALVSAFHANLFASRAPIPAERPE